jgi:putative transcriptional regulator
MEDAYPGSLKGQFLLAMPALLDPNFYQTVTCICEHNGKGAMGVVVNRIHHELSGKDIFEELKMEYAPGADSIAVHLGVSVVRSTLESFLCSMVLHLNGRRA